MQSESTQTQFSQTTYEGSLKPNLSHFARRVNASCFQMSVAICDYILINIGLFVHFLMIFCAVNIVLLHAPSFLAII